MNPRQVRRMSCPESRRSSTVKPCFSVLRHRVRPKPDPEKYAYRKSSRVPFPSLVASCLSLLIWPLGADNPLDTVSHKHRFAWAGRSSACTPSNTPPARILAFQSSASFLERPALTSVCKDPRPRVPQLPLALRQAGRPLPARRCQACRSRSPPTRSRRARPDARLCASPRFPIPAAAHLIGDHAFGLDDSTSPPRDPRAGCPARGVPRAADAAASILKQSTSAAGATSLK